jgi:hypothetical protein
MVGEGLAAGVYVQHAISCALGPGFPSSTNVTIFSWYDAMKNLPFRL